VISSDTVILVAAGVILGGSILLNPSAIGQIAGGIKGSVDPYGGAREAAQVGQEVKLLQTEPDSAAASLAFDCEMARAAGQVVNPAWCAQLARARADWNQKDLQATLTGLQGLQVKIGLVPQGTMLDTGWFDANGVPILVAASVTTTKQVRAQIEDLQKVLGQGPAIVASVVPSGTVTTTATVTATRVAVTVPSGFSLANSDEWLMSPTGTPPPDAPEGIKWMYLWPRIVWAIILIALFLIFILISRAR
jgi:hypothetical protein